MSNKEVPGWERGRLQSLRRFCFELVFFVGCFRLQNPYCILLFFHMTSVASGFDKDFLAMSSFIVKLSNKQAPD